MAYSFLDLAADVLKSASIPLTYQQCWDEGQAKGLAIKLKTKGKTPWQTLGAQLYVDVRDNPDSRFIKVGKRPTRFFLKSRQSELSEALLKKVEVEEAKKSVPKTTYNERDLHPLLTYFVYANPTFSRGRSIYTKTIFHESSRRKGYNEWLHPDIVGVYLPLEDWKQDVIKFNQLLDNNSIRLFSFELKKSLTKSNYRKAFFQAVSNSSWSHEGYLVAADTLKMMIFLQSFNAYQHPLASVSSTSTSRISTHLTFFFRHEYAKCLIGRQSTNFVSRIRTSPNSFKM